MEIRKPGDNFCRQLIEFLEEVKGEKFDIAAAVYTMILEDGDQESAFRYFLEEADEIESSKKTEADQYFTATEIQKLERESGKLIEGILDKLVEEKREPEDFYGELWRKAIFENSMLTQDRERIYALYKIWIDGRIPYFLINDGLKMTNEKFRDLIKKNKKQIRKAIFIMNSRFSQKTERSSLIVEILDSCKTEEEKSVVLAQILAISERKIITDLLRNVRDGIEEGK